MNDQSLVKYVPDVLECYDTLPTTSPIYNRIEYIVAILGNIRSIQPVWVRVILTKYRNYHFEYWEFPQTDAGRIERSNYENNHKRIADRLDKFDGWLQRNHPRQYIIYHSITHKETI